MDASARGDVEAVRSMLESGAVTSVDVMHKATGGTALHAATKHSQHEVAQLLVALGADPNARNDNGTTPVWFAAWYGPASTLRLLLHDAGPWVR